MQEKQKPLENMEGQYGMIADFLNLHKLIGIP